MTWAIIKAGMASLPNGTNFKQIYGVSLLCGVGFTMSLFISGLAFGGVTEGFDPRLGIILGSIISGVIGYLVLKYTLKEDTATGITTLDLTKS